MTSKKELELAILEYEKDLETDENNQWVKNVLKGLKKCEQDLNELEQYKQLERELGIDLITLFKALKSGVWYREWKEPIKHTCGLRLLKSGKSCWGLDNKNYYFPLEEYGKTWSLDKQTLEK